MWAWHLRPTSPARPSAWAITPALSTPLDASQTVRRKDGLEAITLDHRPDGLKVIEEGTRFDGVEADRATTPPPAIFWLEGGQRKFLDGLRRHAPPDEEPRRLRIAAEPRTPINSIVAEDDSCDVRREPTGDEPSRSRPGHRVSVPLINTNVDESTAAVVADAPKHCAHRAPKSRSSRKA
jgi:hypothetical protein